MMSKIFVDVPEKEDNGWTMATCGTENVGNENYVITTYYQKADEVPELCNDAKTFSQLVAGLLNAYYNDVNVIGKQPDDILKMGTPNEKAGIPSDKNAKLPFETLKR